MSVVANRVANTGTVTITVDLTDILVLGVPNPEKRRLGMVRALDELGRAVAALPYTDPDLDAQQTANAVADAARIAAIKAARPTGTL